MLETITNFLTKVDDAVWGVPSLVLILATGLYLTIRLKGIQFTRFPRAIKNLVKNDKSGEHGEVSSFAALCTALSATIGTGNIVGVATAIMAGGPGALFWMWVAALIGTATKFAECMLAVKYREVAKDGHIVGGPFYYIEKGMGKNFKWLAKTFAILGASVGIFGIGTFTQVNGITGAVNNFFDPSNAHTVNLFGADYSISVIIAGVIVAVCAALVIIGGLKRISKVAEVVVPFMAVIYFLAGVMIIAFNFRGIPAAFKTIIDSAFGFRPVAGGVVGSAAIFLSMQKGVARGIFSNEAGLGSAPIAAAAAKTNKPVEQGLVSMLGTVIDTLVICTITGLSIVLTNAFDFTELKGAAVTMKAFELGLPFPKEVSSFILMACLVFFAFTTILGWDYYSERCLDYASKDNKKLVLGYRILYIACIFIGPYMTVEAVWTLADIFNILMAVPNLIALLALSNVCAREVKTHFEREKETEQKAA